MSTYLGEYVYFANNLQGSFSRHTEFTKQKALLYYFET
jgi:hypothetical protein